MRTGVDPDRRSEGRRDRDRLFYSSAWRRLGGVTQVITPVGDGDGMILHNRLTHSEKVAQVTRSIAEDLLAQTTLHSLIAELGGLDVDVAEAAALGHDIGHAPFGHIGEAVLDVVARENLQMADGFEGNAQSFRIVTKIERRNPRYDGLDLTKATLAAVAKYPWERAPTRVEPAHSVDLDKDADYRKHWRKYSAYGSEGDELAAARASLPNTVGDETQSLEASIMDVADDITYAVHDLEDFYLAGILNMHAVVSQLLDDRATTGDAVFRRLSERLKLDYAAYYDDQLFEGQREWVAQRLRGFLAVEFVGSLAQEAIARTRLSKVIAELIAAVEICREPAWPGGPHVRLRQDAWHAVQILKEITRSFVIARSDIALLQRTQQKILEGLVVSLKEWKDSKRDFGRLPPRLREEIEIARAQEDGTTPIGYVDGARPGRGNEDRAILDYICSFTDNGCVSLYHTLTGYRTPRIGAGL